MAPSKYAACARDRKLTRRRPIALLLPFAAVAVATATRAPDARFLETDASIRLSGERVVTEPLTEPYQSAWAPAAEGTPSSADSPPPAPAPVPASSEDTETPEAESAPAIESSLSDEDESAPAPAPVPAEETDEPSQASTTIPAVSTTTQHVEEEQIIETPAHDGMLRVGTAPASANVVNDFEVVASWSSGEDLAASAAISAPDAEFYLEAGTGQGSLVLARAFVEPSLHIHAQPLLKGALADRLRREGHILLRPGQARRLTVEYRCHSEGDLYLTLTLEFEGFAPVVVPWRKTCGGAVNTALTVTTAGGAPLAESVVVLGMPQWNELKVVGTAAARTGFALFADPMSEQPAPVLGVPRAFGDGVCNAEAMMIPAALNGAATTLGGPGQPVEVSVRYGCARYGSCVVTMEIPFHPDMAPYRPATWRWTKMCGGQALGIDVGADVGGSRQALIADGAPNVTAENWRVADNVGSHDIVVVNDGKRSLEPSVRVRALRVQCLNARLCDARLSDNAFNMLKEGEPKSLDVNYNCKASGNSLVRLVIETEGRDPVSVMWQKDCKVWIDSLWGVLLTSFMASMCAACACVGGMKVCCSADDGDTEVTESVESESARAERQRQAGLL